MSVSKTQGLPAPKTDYQLLFQRLEEALLKGEPSEAVAEQLGRREVWSSFDAESACRWARLAQMAGLVPLALEILAWVNASFPACREAWTERLELLRLLGDLKGLVQTRAQAKAVLGDALDGPRQSEEPWTEELDGAPVDATPDSESLESGQGLGAIEAPFAELRREERLYGLFLSLFQGREDAFARQWADSKSGSQGYAPVRRPIQHADLQEHFKGQKTYGIYLLRQDSTVRLGVIDIDLAQSLRGRTLTAEERGRVRADARFLLRRLVELSSEAAMPCLVEFSGGKGYHLWYPLAEPMPARSVRLALQELSRKVAGDVKSFEIEIFPKQDTLSGKGMGNLVKLPLGIHRATGKRSYLLLARDTTLESQLDFLQSVVPIRPEAIEAALGRVESGKLLVHPKHERWAGEFPELAELEQKCTVMAQIICGCRDSRSLSLREEKILFGTVGLLPRARPLLHHLFEQLPEYNRPLLDYKISRIRGTPLGCKRIHSLWGDGEGGLPCRLDTAESGYPHPLLHLGAAAAAEIEPASERVANLQDALEVLSLAIRQVQRFLPH